MTEWLKKHGFVYALLRLSADNRPAWVRNLGLRDVELNGEALEVPPPRLRYKRSIGSFVTKPNVDVDYLESEHARYDGYLRGLLTDAKERART